MELRSPQSKMSHCGCRVWLVSLAVVVGLPPGTIAYSIRGAARDHSVFHTGRRHCLQASLTPTFFHSSCPADRVPDAEVSKPIFSPATEGALLRGHAKVSLLYCQLPICKPQQLAASKDARSRRLNSKQDAIRAFTEPIQVSKMSTHQQQGSQTPG